MNEVMFVLIICQVIYLMSLEKIELTSLKYKYYIDETFQFYHMKIFIALAGVIALVFYICMKHKLSIIITFAFIIMTLISYFEYTLYNINHMIDKEIKLNEMYDFCETGDIILENMPHVMNGLIWTIPVFTLGTSHIGMIIKQDKQLYLLHCSSEFLYCEHTKHTTSGVMLSKLDTYLKNGKKGILIKTNLHDKIKHEKLVSILDETSNISYGSNDWNCINYFIHILNKCDVLQRKYKVWLYTHYSNVLNKNIYKDDFDYDAYKIMI